MLNVNLDFVDQQFIKIIFITAVEEKIIRITNINNNSYSSDNQNISLTFEVISQVLELESLLKLILTHKDDDKIFTKKKDEVICNLLKLWDNTLLNNILRINAANIEKNSLCLLNYFDKLRLLNSNGTAKTNFECLSLGCSVNIHSNSIHNLDQNDFDDCFITAEENPIIKLLTINNDKLIRIYIQSDQMKNTFKELSKASIIENTNNDLIYLIIDWDDTLFPTQWVQQIQYYMQIAFKQQKINNSNKYSSESKIMYPLIRWKRYDRISLRLVENNAIEFITSCHNLTANIIIITNASYNWVDTCCKLYYFNFKAKLEEFNIPIVSMRDVFRKYNINKDECLLGTFWKTYAFHHLLKFNVNNNSNNVILDTNNNKPRIICSIGDSDCERTALLSCILTQPCKAYFKSIKFQLTNNVNKVMDQLAHTSNSIYDLLHIQSHNDIIIC